MAVNKEAAGQELARELKKLRTDAGLNVRDMGARIGVSAANISHWETGNRLIPLERLTSWLDALGVDAPERERFFGLRREAEGRPGELAVGPSVEPQLAQLIEHEGAARRITAYNLGAVPGLLQITDYSRAILNDNIRVALRAGRRDIITRDVDPVELVALIDSEVLMRPIAPHDVTVRQLRHLVDMAELPNVTIQIVPATVPGWHPGLNGSFSIVEFPAAAPMVDVEPMVYVEHYRASAVLWDKEDVAAYIAAAEKIKERAMTPDRTSEVIAEMLQGMDAS